MIHQTGVTLGAQHAKVDRIIAIAIDADRLSVLEMDAHAAAAGTHVAGGRGDLVGDRRHLRNTVFGPAADIRQTTTPKQETAAATGTL